MSYPNISSTSGVSEDAYNGIMYTAENTRAPADNTSDNTQWFEYESPLSKILENYVTLPLFFVSVIGNGFIIIIFSRNHYRNNLPAMLYQILAAADGLVVLINDGLHTLPFVILGKSAYTHNPVTCKLAIFLSTWFRTFSVWIIVALTVERLINVYWPYQAKQVNTKRNYGCVVFGMLLLSCIIYAPLLITVGHEDVVLNGQNIGICRISGQGSIRWYIAIFHWINTLISSFIPFLFVCASNVVIIHDLMTTSGAANNKANRHDDRLKSNIIVLLLISTTSVVFTLPDPLYLLLNTYIADPASDAFHRLITFSYTLPTFDSINRSINIALFCIFGRKFRQYLKYLLLCKRRGVERSRDCRSKDFPMNDKHVPS